MTEIVEGLGETVEKFTHEVEIATATEDIPYRGPDDSDMPGMDGVIKRAPWARNTTGGRHG